MKKTIEINNLSVSVKTTQDDNDFISLTDMARSKNPDEPKDVVKNWMRTRFTVEFLGLWEQQNNPDFKGVEFDPFMKEAGNNSFTLSPEKWLRTTNAIGIKVSRGKNGGTFAHKDIAFEFATWLSPQFKLYLIKEFQRLKEQEKQTIHSLEWQIKRSLSKTNYRIHTDAIARKLEGGELNKWQERMVYANEADMLNLILWGKTAKEWEEENPEEVKKKLNMRDMADITDLILLSNLETLNARFVDEGKSKEDRVQMLSEIAETQRKTLAKNLSAQKIEKLSEKNL